MERVVIAKAKAALIDSIGPNETPAIKIAWRLRDGGATRTSTLWLTDNALEFTVKALRAAGYIGNDLMQFSEASGPELERLLPKDVELVLEEKPSATDPTKKFEEVKYVNEIGGGARLEAKNAPGRAALLGLNAKFKAEVAKSHTEKPPETMPEYPPQDTSFDPSEFDDDEFAGT